MDPKTRKTAVVSGGGSGIGREIALELARRGHPLALLGRRLEPLEQTLALAGLPSEQGLSLACDVTDATAVGAACGEIEARLPPVGIVVPAAGVAVVKPFGEITPEEFTNTLAVNVTGTFLLLQRLLPAMKTAGEGWIFLLLSVAARKGFPGWAAYCASKWGLAGMAAALREELAGSGVRLTAIYPGATDTPIWEGVAGDWNRSAMARPHEVARAVAFALDAEPGTLFEEIHLGPAGGAL
jgi:3-hydroxybutyrate dehydrogenase